MRLGPPAHVVRPPPPGSGLHWGLTGAALPGLFTTMLWSGSWVIVMTLVVSPAHGSDWITTSSANAAPPVSMEAIRATASAGRNNLHRNRGEPSPICP